MTGRPGDLRSEMRRADVVLRGGVSPVAVPEPEPAPVFEEDAYDAPASSEPSLDEESWRPSGFLEWFAIGQTALPALLYIPGAQPLRPAIRAGAFLISLLAFGIFYFGRGGKRRVRHPAGRWLVLVLVCLLAMIFHPDSESVLAGVGQTALYVAVFCPLFWVPAFAASGRRQLIRVLAILLICNGLNSVVGVLQVYDPQRWMPAEFSSTFAMNRDILAGSTYVGPNGRRIVRPPGLYDTPGAVCGAGTVAALLGLVIFLERIRWWKRAIALGFSASGIAAIYLSHVRASAVVGGGMMVVYLLMLIFQGRKRRAAEFLGMAVGVVSVAFSVATFLGGQTVRDRFLSLFEAAPTDVYYQNRGVQLEYAFDELLLEYPLGAGLGRWGMVGSYVGVSASRQIWAEIQPTAWILDGGLFLLVFYGMALLTTVVWELKLVGLLPDRNDRLWASAVVAANIGTLALVVSFVPFTTQLGLQFWFLEGLLYGAMALKLPNT